MLTKRILLSTVCIAALGATAAHAANDATTANEVSAIEQLPEKGNVTLVATVESVDSDKMRFVVKDSTGETIDVHVTAATNVKEGDRVQVKGTMRDDAAGLGDEIAATNVKVVGKGAKTSDARSKNPTLTERVNDLADKPIVGSTEERNGSNPVSDKDMGPLDNDSAISSNAAWTDVDTRTTVRTDSKANTAAAAKTAAKIDTIKNLPEKGPVSFIAVVESVTNDKKRIVVKDATGDKIDVHSATPVQVSKGDRVQINGQMRDEMLGMGEEITASSVKVLTISSNM